MKTAKDLTPGTTYQIGEGFYTFRGYMNKGRNVVLWVRQDGPQSPVTTNIKLSVTAFNKELAPYIK